MKKLVILSIIASLALADNTVTSLTVKQTNEIYNNTNISNDVTTSQGQTDIKNNSNINNVTIIQHNNTIDNSQISGTNSEIYQGLTSIEESKLENAKLTSSNTIEDVIVTGGKSTITQGNLLIGGESNVTGITSGGGGHGGGATSVDITITETNIIKDSNIEDSRIDQGLTTISGEAIISNTFKLEQENTINRVDSDGNSNGQNDMDNSAITQGLTRINGGETSNIEQNIKNNMSYIDVDGTTIHQSSINLSNSTVKHINDGNLVTTVDEINVMEHIIGQGVSSITQSSIDISEESYVDNLQRYDRGNKEKNNWIDEAILTNSEIKQSTFSAKKSTVTNVEYRLHNDNNGRYAINDMYNVSAINDSNLRQDETDIQNGTLENSTITRINLMTELQANHSEVSQNKLLIKNSTLNNSTLKENNSIGEWDGATVAVTNANLSQGSTIITD